MRKLVLVAALLLLPAIALGTEVTFDHVVICTGFEDYEYGTIKGVADDNLTWGSRDVAEATWIIDDPTDSGHGKVVAFTDTVEYDPEVGGEDGKVRLYANRNDYSHPITYPTGYQTFQYDLYLHTDLFDAYDNIVLMEQGPGRCHYHDGGIKHNDKITLWDSGPQYDPDNASLVTTAVADLPLNEWFTIKQIWDIDAGTYDFYLNDVLVAEDAPIYGSHDNQMVWEYYFYDLFAGYDYQMYLDNVCWSVEVPEPSILLLSGVGILALLRRKKK